MSLMQKRTQKVTIFLVVLFTVALFSLTLDVTNRRVVNTVNLESDRGNAQSNAKDNADIKRAGNAKISTNGNDARDANGKYVRVVDKSNETRDGKIQSTNSNNKINKDDISQTKPSTPSKPAKPRIAIMTLMQLTGNEREVKRYMIESLMNKQRYARMYNYELIIVSKPFNNEGLPTVWNKIDALKYYLQNTDFEWIWYLDADAFITNMTLTIEDHVLSQLPSPREQYDLIANKDCNGFNAGSFFLRNTPWSISFLDKIWSHRHDPTYRKHIYQEQEAGRVILDTDAEAKKKTYWIDYHRINAYLHDCAHWDKGDFVVHLAGYLDKDAAAQALYNGLQDILKGETIW